MNLHVIGLPDDTIGFALAGVSADACRTPADLARALDHLTAQRAADSVVAITRDAAQLDPVRIEKARRQMPGVITVLP